MSTARTAWTMSTALDSVDSVDSVDNVNSTNNNHVGLARRGSAAGWKWAWVLLALLTLSTLWTLSTSGIFANWLGLSWGSQLQTPQNTAKHNYLLHRSHLALPKHCYLLHRSHLALPKHHYLLHRRSQNTAIYCTGATGASKSQFQAPSGATGAPKSQFQAPSGATGTPKS